MRDKKLQNGLIVTIILTICGIFCAQVLLKAMDGNKITYAEPDTTIEVIEEIVEKQVIRQNTPILAKKENAGKELILIDKSGSMKDFVNAVYSENVQFFKNNDLWSFDTEVSKNEIEITSIEFGGDTNVFKAINEAAKAEYDTVWLCSDLEHNTGELKLLDEAKEMTIIVYSPKPLSEKANLALETLKEANDVRVITIS
ncbi:MAG: hypothetical protein IJN50_02540 [Clostridia bacterium]|nr:hypothetical protein [Clostridia bacterium]